MDIDVFENEALKRAKRLNNQALFANEHFRAIHEVRELYQKHREVLKTAEFFFLLSQYANQAYVYFAITKAFCTNEETDESGLILLGDMNRHNDGRYNHPFEVVEYESTLSDDSHVLQFNSLEEACEIICAQKDEKKETIKRIKTLRNKYYGHMDLAKSKDYTKFFEENEVNLSEIDELLNLNFTICNCANMLLDGSSLFHNVMHPGSLELLARYAEKGKDCCII